MFFPQAAKWFAAALALPDVLSEAAEAEAADGMADGGAIAEEDDEEGAESDDTVCVSACVCGGYK